MKQGKPATCPKCNDTAGILSMGVAVETKRARVQVGWFCGGCDVEWTEFFTAHYQGYVDGLSSEIESVQP